MRTIRTLVCALLLTVTFTVGAAPAFVAPASAHPHYRSDCNKYVPLLRAYGLPVATFKRIMWRESGCDPMARNVNRNGSVDRCLLQLNSIHLKPGGVAHGIGAALLYIPRICIKVAARLYRRSGMAPWR